MFQGDSEEHFRQYIAEKAIEAVEQWGKGCIYTAEDAGIVMGVKQRLLTMLRQFQQSKDSSD